MRDDHIEILLLIDFLYQTSTEGVPEELWQVFVFVYVIVIEHNTLQPYKKQTGLYEV